MAFPTRSTYFTASEAYTASFATAYPATVPAGALVIWLACWRNNNTTPVACDDTSLTALSTINAGTTNVYAGYKVADGTEANDPITFSIPSAQNGPAVVCHVIEGYTGTPQQAYIESSADTSLGSMSVTGDDSLVLWHWHTDANASAMASFDETDPLHDYTGWSYVGHEVGRTSSGSPVVVVFDRQQAAAGTTPAVDLNGETNGWTYILAVNGATAATAPTLTSPTAVSIGTTTVTPRVTTDTGNGTCYYVITPQAESEPSNTQVEAGQNAAGGAPVASGSQVVSASGVITFSEVTGLTAGTAYRISYAHSGTPS